MPGNAREGEIGTWRRYGALCFFALLLCACEEPAETDMAASEARVRLLSAEQYVNVVSDVFGEDVGESVIPPMPPMPRTDGLLASGASAVGLTSDQLSQIQQAASVIAAKVVDWEHRHYLLPCGPADASAADALCARQIVTEIGRLLFRRPLDAGQQRDLVEIATAAARETEDFYEGVALALEALLISPEFLFIVDQADADQMNIDHGVAAASQDDSLEPDPVQERSLDAYSLASRLSFFLWNSAPDTALLDAAESGELLTEAGLRQQLDRMLQSDRLEAGMRAFFDDMLAFDDFDSLAKDPTVYPMVTAATLRDAREQTLRTIIDHLLVQRGDYRDLFVTRKTFMSMALSAVYGTAAVDAWVPHEFSDDDVRHGLLTHVSFLAANSHSVRSSPTLRGKAMRELLLCQHVPEPPPNVDFSKLEDAENASTARERLQVHNTNPSCAGCHLITDPMGLSLENFDGAGVFRETENGAELDIRGELDGVFYDEIGGLAQAMRNHPKLSYCLVNRLYAYATGGPVSLKNDRDKLRAFEARFVDGGYQFHSLLRDLAMSRAFSMVRTDTESTLGSEREQHATRPASALELTTELGEASR
ncbi:MAG: hypothetical protein Cons2KO_17690 [Congregibacter sp.]